VNRNQYLEKINSYANTNGSKTAGFGSQDDKALLSPVNGAAKQFDASLKTSANQQRFDRK
jgi:hypothetical protein